MENFIFGNFWELFRPIRPQNSLGGLIWPQIWNQWPRLPTYACAYCLYGLSVFWQPRRPLQPPNSLWGQIWPQIWNQWPQLPTYPCAYCLHVLGPLWGPFGGLRGHYSLQTASKLKFYLGFGICGPNCICNHVFLGCLGLLWENERRLKKKKKKKKKTTCLY